MALTSGPSSTTFQTCASSYETAFEASAPAGSGSDGSPVRLFTVSSGAGAVLAERTTFSGAVTEHLIPDGESKELGSFPNGVRKLRLKYVSGSGTACWDSTIP